MKTLAMVMLVFGLLMIALSLILLSAIQPGSPEEAVSILNSFLGSLLVLLGSGYLVHWKKKNRSYGDQLPSMKVKGKDLENT